MKVQQNNGITSRRVGSTWLVLEPNKKYIRHLNQTAGFIWSRTKHPITVQEISHDVAEKFSIALRVAEQDVQEFVANYLREGFLQKAD